MPPADVCLLLEGTYPYISGGVSVWVHDLLKAHPRLTFDAVSLVPDAQPRRPVFEVPPNLRRLVTVPLQVPPSGRGRPLLWRDAGAAAARARVPLLRLVRGEADAADLVEMARVAASVPVGSLGRRLLLDSPEAFAATCDAYRAMLPRASFLDFFWSWRTLMNAMLAVLLPAFPPARCYHTISTGFAGLLGARLAATTGRPLILSEHGIYTNERRIEVAMAEWMFAGPEPSLAPVKAVPDLRDLWITAFEGFARLTYAAADPIITLYRGNQALQRRDGADPARLRVIPNGIDADRYAAIPRLPMGEARPPTIALIGRVVPIKDVKTFIRSAALLRGRVPGLKAEILGPQQEDPDYARECAALIEELGVGDTVTLRGRVDVMEWLGRIDLLVLTSISEAQPLTILEAGAAGLPCVATDVGSCREMIEGDPEAEQPPLGPGGAVVPVADPAATAEAIAGLLLDPARWMRASEAIRARIRARYLKADCDGAYAGIYEHAMAAPDRAAAAAG